MFRVKITCTDNAVSFLPQSHSYQAALSVWGYFTEDVLNSR